jgi:hypothetical protein
MPKLVFEVVSMTEQRRACSGFAIRIPESASGGRIALSRIARTSSRERHEQIAQLVNLYPQIRFAAMPG